MHQAGRLLGFAAVLFLIFSSNLNAATSGVGATAGAFDVNANGAAIYTIPIHVSPGINGMEPKLALIYNSQNGNGLLGVGWSLSGLSSITHCPATIAQDGFRAGIDFNAERFCWNGQRLINVGTGTDANGAYREYRTEIESFARIRAYGATISDPTSFKSWTKDRQIMEFGNTANSRIEAQGKTQGLVWAANKISDANGNYLTVTYVEDGINGEYYPSSIDYTGNAALTPNRKVTFEYNNAGAIPRPDAIVKYVAGSKVSTTKRLTAIKTQFDLATVRTYNLAYEQEDTGIGRSRLISVQECGSDGVCYTNKLTFGWQNKGTVAYTQNTNSAALNWSAGNEFGKWNQLVDINSNGIMDVFKVTDPATGTVQVLTGSESGAFTASGSTPGVITNSANGFGDWNELADVNGDGLIDIFKVNSSNGDVTVYLGNENVLGGFITTNPLTFLGLATFGSEGFRFWNQLIDMNGDGLMDVFRIDRSVSEIDGYGGVFYPHFEIIYGKMSGAVFSFDVAGRYISKNNNVRLAPYYDYSSGQPRWGFRATNQLADINGDGVIDIFRVTNRLNGDIQALLGKVDSSAQFVLAGTQSGALVGQNYQTNYSTYLNFDNQLVDINGDGIVDIVRAIKSVNYRNIGNYCDPRTWTGSGYGFCQNPTYVKENGYLPDIEVLIGKGDGSYSPPARTQNVIQSAGFIVNNPVYTSPSYDGVLNIWYITSTADVSNSGKGMSHLNQFADMDGDGFADVVSENPSTGAVSISYGKGDGTFGIPQSAGLSVNAGGNGFRAMNQLADMNGDGLPDFFVNNNGTGNVVLSGDRMPGLLTSVNDGYKLNTSITYDPLTKSSVYSWAGPGYNTYSYPRRAVKFPLYVVSQYVYGDGQNVYPFSFKYDTAVTDYMRGWMGFRIVSKTDQRTTPNIQEIAYYRQDYPFAGMPFWQYRRLSTANGGLYLDQKTTTWGSRDGINGNAAAIVKFVFPTQTVQTVYEPNASYAQAVSTTTDYLNGITGAGSYDTLPYDQYGNPETVRVTYSDGHVIETAYTNAYAASDFLGLLSTQTTQTKHTTPASVAQTRTTDDTYNLNGQLANRVVNAGDPLASTMGYSYDGYGQPYIVSETGLNAQYNQTGGQTGTTATRTTSYAYTNLATRNPSIAKTAGALTETTVKDAYYGVDVSLTDVSGVTTTWGYDGFGRKAAETRAGATTTIDYLAGCVTDCINTNIKFNTRAITTAGGQTLDAVVTQYDALAREQRTVTKGTAGQSIYKDTNYDSAGRVLNASRPYFAGTAAAYAITSYDSLSRPYTITAPNGAVTTYTYSGKATAGITTAVSLSGPGVTAQTTTYYKDSQGKTTRITDALGKSTNYTYGPFGVLTNITDPKGNNIASGYDIFGNKISQNDPDMGAWQYKYNAFGELVWQKDAYGNVLASQYDNLGRMAQRVEYPSGGTAVTSTWVYDTPKAGKLGSATRGTEVESYTYDAYARLATITNRAGALSYTYDGFSRLDTQTYPAGAVKVQYKYFSNGLLSQIVDAVTPATVYWQATAYSAEDQVTNEQWNNGLTGTRGYDPNTGALMTIDASKVAMTIQNLGYSYDVLGNLKTQTNAVNGVSETLYYDALNRLLTVQSTASATKQFQYDEIGNLLSKTGVGAYTYGARPHAVASIDPTKAANATQGDANANGQIDTGDPALAVNMILGNAAFNTQADCNSDGAVNVVDVLCINAKLLNTSATGTVINYTYDANGNLTNDGTRVISYTAFNKPASITKGASTTTYTYDAALQRLTKTSATGLTTAYLGKAYEKDTDSANAVTEERFYVSNGDSLIVMFKKQGATLITNYIHTDRLGSIDAVTDATGALVEGLSFDAYGQPRNAGWSASAASFTSTSRGYTGHEMDAESGLINMNARLYDPVIGRFLSADSVIPDIDNPQSLNRYSYAVNNPFRYVDPTGHDLVGCWDGTCTFDNGTVYNSGTGAFFHANGDITTGWGGFVEHGSGSWGYNSSRLWTNCVASECGSASEASSALIGPPSLYSIVDTKTGPFVTGSVAHVSTQFGAVNGMLNEPKYAISLMFDHIKAEFPDAKEYTLFYNPTEGFWKDVWESNRDKMGFTTDIAKQFAMVLADTQASGMNVKWVPHSQGGVIFTEAVRYNGGDLSTNSVYFHAGANNRFVTESIMAHAGIKINGWRDHPFDPVPNIAGFNTLNPIKLIGSGVALPFVMWGGPELSPHTMPYEGRP